MTVITVYDWSGVHPAGDGHHRDVCQPHAGEDHHRGEPLMARAI